MSNIPMPEISPNFTIDDIHKIREWYDKVYEGMTTQEISAHTSNEAKRFLAALNSPRDPALKEEVKRCLESVRKPEKVSV